MSWNAENKICKMDYQVGWEANVEYSGVPEGRVVGFYTQRERLHKISHFKKKMLTRKQLVPVVKEYEGRSKSAFRKPRKNGKFVKAELGHLFMMSEEQRQERTRLIDQHLTKLDYESAVTFLIEY